MTKWQGTACGYAATARVATLPAAAGRQCIAWLLQKLDFRGFPYISGFFLGGHVLFSREQILSRQKEGIAAQKAAGTYTGGRPRIKVDQKLFNSVMSKWKSGAITAVQAMKELSVTKATFYRWAKKMGQQS